MTAEGKWGDGRPAFWTGPFQSTRLPASVPQNASNLYVVTGVDQYSSGAAIWRWRRTGGKWPSIDPLASWRWKDVPLTTEENIVHVFQAIRDYAADQGIQLP